MAGSTSLVNNFDDIVASTDVLVAGTESAFVQFVTNQMGFQSRFRNMVDDNARLKGESEANEIKLKHARSSFDYQMQKRADAEEQLKEYQRQFTIIAELLGDQRLNTLNEEERKSLAFLKTNRRQSSQQSPRSFLSDSSAALSPSEVSLDPVDIDGEVSFLRSGTRWKRRRTASIDKISKKASPPKKKKRSNDGSEVVFKKTKSSLSPEGSLHKVPRLEKQFKKPPPLRNRRKPSKGHLHQLATDCQSSDEVDFILSPHRENMEDQEEVVTPSAPPYSPRIYPDLPSSSSSENMPPPSTPISTPTITRTHSDINMHRRHTFFTKTIIKVETCQVCKKKVKFGKNCLKCRDCRAVCHPECRTKAPLPCIPSVPTPKKMKLQDADLAQFCPHTIPRVPAIVIHCVNEIEKRGLTQVGLYRVPGSDKVVKEVKERLLRAKGNPGLEKVDDVNVLCGVLKEFLRSLREPLLTFRMHKAFMKTSVAESDEEGLATTLEAIAELPPSNKDTLAFVILHLQRVASYSDANKMPVASLAKVFGPTIVGHGSTNPEPSVMWQDTQKQPKVMQRLLGISGDYWRQYLSPMDNPDQNSPTPSTQSSPGVTSPATPELRPVPESPFLGSCQSPRSKLFSGRTPLKTRTGVNMSSAIKPKRTGNFFAALN